MQCISVLLGSDDLERAECETYERVSDSESKKGSSGLAKECKDVPEVQGIPIPKQRWFRCDRLVHTLLACLLICSPWIRRQGLKEQRFLSANKVSVEVTNCQVIVQDGTQPGILLQRWFFMGTVKERSKEGNLRLVATMRSRLSSWFRCNVAIIAPSKANQTHSIQALNVTVSNSERPAAVLLSGGVVRGRIEIIGNSAAVVNATGTKSLDEIIIRSREPGLIQLHLDQSSASKWWLQGSSPVFVESVVPVKLRATSVGRFRAPEIREDGNNYDLCSEARAPPSLDTAVDRRLEPDSKFNCSSAQLIDFERQGDSNINVDLPCQKCKVKAGAAEIRLTGSSKEALLEASEFVQSRGQNLPWLIVIQIGGLDQSWALASTIAFTYFDASWFAALSFGVLAPVTKYYFLTLEGDPFAEIGDVLNGSKSLVSADELDEDCPAWKQTAEVTKLLVEALNLESFSLLAKVSQCRSGLVFEKSKTGFTLDWNPSDYPVNIQIAILMNGCCAIALSVIVVRFARNFAFPFLYKRLSEGRTAMHASQRLQVGLVEETNINVSFVHYPQRGLHLVWSKERSGPGVSTYVIRLKSSHSETRVRVNAGETQNSDSTVSLFLSLDRADLRYVKDILSVRVITISNSQVVGHTCWSSPVRVEPLWATAHLPFKVIAALLPKQQNKVSISTFLHSACSQFTPPALTLVLEKLHVICAEGRVAQDFCIKLFFGTLEASRQGTEKKKEESFAKTSTVIISDWLSCKPRADVWTAEDVFGVDICPEEPLRLTPPFRDSMRSGATLLFHMVAQNEQVLATGVADWNDLLDAYPTRPGAKVSEFTFQADLVDASGEVLGVLCLRPDFKSEELELLGKKSLEPNRSNLVWFQDDVPGDVYQQGMDRFVVWDDRDDADSIAAHVDLYLEQAGKVPWQLMSEDVRFSSQAFCWVVDADLSDSPYVCCRIIMVAHGENLPDEPSWLSANVSGNVLCTSNWFFVLQTLTLRHLERAYGAFCRMNNMHMETASASVLKAEGIQVRTVNVRGCVGIRRPFPFESAPEDLVKCSGGLLLASISHTIIGANSDDRYRLRSHRIFLLEGLRLLEGNAHWYENHMVSAGFDASLHLQEMLGSSYLAPIVDFGFHVLMSVCQLLCFFAFPCFGIAFLQFLQSFQVEAAAFDVLQVCDMAAHAAEIGRLPVAAVGFFGCHMLISLLCVLVANAMQDTPGVIPHFADRALELVSTFTSAVSAFFLFAMSLFFLIGALLHPASALKPLLVLGSCGAVVGTMWMQFSSLTGGLLKVIEFQVDAVFDAMLQNMTARIKQEQEDTVSSYDGDDLIFALKKADNRFQGLDAEDQPLRQFSKDPLCRCVKPDTEMIKQIQENISRASRGKRATGEALTSLEGEMTSEQLQQLAELYKHYLGKTSLDTSLEWRIFEETDALTDIMLREHNMRLQLLNFGAIASVDGGKAPTASKEKTPLPKAYLMYKAIYRDKFDQLVGMIVKWADPFFQWTPIVEKVTNFFDDSVPKFICSCATASFDGNRINSIGQKVLAKVAQHVEETMHRDPAKTMTLNHLIAELKKNPDDGWASGLLYPETSGVYNEKQVVAFVKEQVKQALPNLKTTRAIPVYKLVTIFEHLIDGRVWWSALVPFLKEDCGFLDQEIDKEDLANGFKRTSKGCGFMDYQDIPDVIMWMTDGGLWKSATVALLREIEVCGELGNLELLGTEDDEQSRVQDEWNPPTWPPWVLDFWCEATDEETDPKEGEASFLQKSDVPGFINALMLDTHPKRLTLGEALEPVPGFPEWKYKAMAGMQGCPAEVWRYIDDKYLARLRGIPWEGFDCLLEAFDLDMPEPASRKIFSGTKDGSKGAVGAPAFLEAPDLMRTIDNILTQYRPISLPGFEKLLKNAGITLPKPVIESLFGQLDDITLQIGEVEEFVCEDLVSLNKLGKVVEQYLSGGMWLEAAYGVLQNEEIETSLAEISRKFATIDKQEFGVLHPSGVIKLMMSLQRTGISYDTFADMILKDMRFVVNDSQIRLLFNMVDRSGNGSISKAEFIEGFHTLMRQLVPHIILNSLSVLPEQIASHILKALILLLLLFAFLFVSMDALTPSFETGNMDFMGGVQAAVAGMAALGVRMQSTSGMNKERIQEAIAARLSDLLPGVKPHK